MDRVLEVAAWNVLDKINDPNIYKNALGQETDIAVFPEAYAEGDKLEQATIDYLRQDGRYELFEHPNGDDDGRKDRHVLLVAAKPELIASADSVLLASRYAIGLTLTDGTRFLGVHLDDRSEARRQEQATEALKWLGSTAILAGDFNAMHDGFKARTIRKAGRLVESQEAIPPDVKIEQNDLRSRIAAKKGRFVSLGQRTVAMASGETMKLLAEADLHDADPTHASTMRKGPFSAQLDHILYRGNIRRTQTTRVGQRDPSDHNRVHAKLHVTTASTR